MHILALGGAGYVGSSVCARLIDEGHSVTVLDDLSMGHRELLLTDRFVQARIGDRATVREILASSHFDAVLHFAAKSSVGESFLKPQEYFENNVHQTEIFLDEMLTAGVQRVVFSSSCAVFGNPDGRPIDESLPTNPVNPYGQTKLEAERLMQKMAHERGLKAICLRYFNAAGAEPKLRVGEWHEPETHLIPRVLQAALRGSEIEIFGNDYPTRDGTCVRDYVHVWDLAEAHIAAVKRLFGLKDRDQGAFETFNLGSESGFSVLEVISTAERICGRKIQTRMSARRQGDPPALVASSKKAMRDLGFRAQISDLGSILLSAWEWEMKLRETLR